MTASEFRSLITNCNLFSGEYGMTGLALRTHGIEVSDVLMGKGESGISCGNQRYFGGKKKKRKLNWWRGGEARGNLVEC